MPPSEQLNMLDRFGLRHIEQRVVDGAVVVKWSQDVPTNGSIQLPPDPRALDALGRNHSLETALADLVDNSIDAKATNVVIRLVRVRGRLRALYVIDNGVGIAPESINAAMTFGARREYRGADLGHFGVGLKAASFSQATSLTVMSRADGHDAVGRRWRAAAATEQGYVCDIVSEEYVESEFKQEWRVPLTHNGTIIRWDDVVSFPASDDPKNVETFIDHAVNVICQHLGLVFHKFLENGQLNIELEVDDVDAAVVGPPIPVTPINPFGYFRSGHPDYPKTLVSEVDGCQLEFRCHIWPGRSSTPQFRVSGHPLDHQGLYFYRRDRLLQAGGWVGVHAPDRRLQLARVEMCIDDGIVGLFHMNPEKSRVLVGPEFARLAAAAHSADGVTLNDYLAAAEQVFKAASARSAKRTPMIYPGAGLPGRVRATIQREIPEVRGEAPIDIRWDTFEDDSFFEVDRDNQTLWLNKRYRAMLLGGKHGGLNDLPLVKSLLYLLAENLFEGSHLGPKDKDNIELWQTILTAAVQAER